jgi:general secretion pathway protein F
MNAAMSKIAEGIRQGDGLAGPLAAARIVPDIAIGFVRTGEESSQLGMMLSRLGDVLDRDVKVRLTRVVAILTPLITVILGASVAGIIAAIMSAILGFNELAVTQ